MKTMEELKDFYEKLNTEFEGYILLSNKKLEHIFTKKQTLPKWEELHDGKNFIIEAHFFDGDRSISIRQVNDKFIIIDKKLSSFKKENKPEETFITINNTKVKIATIWEEQKDELCESFEVLKPTMQLFCGFEGEKNGKQ